MKFKRLIMLCCIFLTSYAAYAANVSKGDALAMVKSNFSGKDVDYYYMDKGNLWYIFVDAEPMKGWEHEAYLYAVPKTSTNDSIKVRPRYWKVTTPPSGNYLPLEKKNRYGSNYKLKPKVAKNTDMSNSDSEAARRTYAVILSGGVSKLSNYERYWNDCSFIYQTLVNKYGVPKENIYPIMSDGTDPGADMNPIKGDFVSQPLDLDGDGLDDIKYAATNASIKAVLSELYGKIGEDDHLFFYVIDHGGSSDKESKSYINLWGSEKLTDSALAEMLRPFADRYANVNVLLGQCFSGGFIDDLESIGCVVATASAGNEVSWACSDKPYDEFVYQWTCAVNEANHLGSSVVSDTDGNGRVTMDEAFAYAKANDRQTTEHPQYSSTPLSVGEDLSFNHLAPAVDLYVKDNSADTGKEPNTTIDKFWISPSIWVRNQEDNIEQHENPEYYSGHRLVYVHVRIHNRGKKEYTGGKWLQVYWAQASTGLTAKAWRGRELYNNRNATGGPTEIRNIDTIPAGGYRDVVVSWALPSLLEDYPDGNFHFCLLAKILDTNYDEAYVEGKTKFSARDNNDQAQKNVTIIKKIDLGKEFNVYVRNVSSTSKAYALELVPRTSNDEKIFSCASVEMKMTPTVYDAWKRGGLKSRDIEVVSSNSDNGLNRVKFLNSQSRLESVNLNGNEFDVVSLKFRFLTFSSTSNKYTLDLIQRDEDGNVIGGETFEVESPTLTLQPGIINSTSMDGGQVLLSASVGQNSTYEWTGENGESLGESQNIIVTPSSKQHDYTVYATKEDGDVVADSVSIDSDYGIKTVDVIRENGTIVVTLCNKAPENAVMSLVSVSDGTSKYMGKISSGDNMIMIDSSAFQCGMYVVLYMVNGDIVDETTISI